MKMTFQGSPLGFYKQIFVDKNDYWYAENELRGRK